MKPQATIHDDNHGIYYPFMLHEHELGLIVKSLEMLSMQDKRKLESLYGVGKIEAVRGKLAFPIT